MFQLNFHICSTSLLRRTVTKSTSKYVEEGNWKIVWWFLRHILCVESGNNKKLAEIFLDDARKRQRGKAAHMNIKLTEISKNFGEIL